MNSFNAQNLMIAFFVGTAMVLYGIVGGYPNFLTLLLSFSLGPILMVLNILRISFFHLPTLNLEEQENDTKKARIAGSGISDKNLQEAVTKAGYRLTGILG